jgi:hypothetical protein
MIYETNMIHKNKKLLNMFFRRITLYPKNQSSDNITKKLIEELNEELAA